MKKFIDCVILFIEVLFLQDISCAPTTASLGEGVTKLQAADSGPSKGDIASFSSSLHITHDPSSNSFKTIDTGAAEVIVASDNAAGVASDSSSTNEASVVAVGSSVKLEATVETAKGFSNSVSLTGDALSGSGTGQSVSVGSGPLVTHHDSFDTKADLKNVETLKTVETSGGSSEILPEKSADTTGTETLKEADTSNIGENATVEIQVVETLKTVEEKAIEKKLFELGITTQKPTLPPSIEIVPDDAKSITPELLEMPAPLERLELPKPLTRIAAPRPFLDTSIYARTNVEPELKLVSPQLVPTEPSTSTKSPTSPETTTHHLEGKITLDFKATDPPLLPTNTPLLTTDTSLLTTDTSLLAADTPSLIINSQLLATEFPSVATALPLVVSEPPLVVTESPLVVTDPPLVVTDPPLVVTDPPLVATKSPLMNDISKVDPPLIKPILLELPSQNSSLREETTFIDIKPDKDLKGLESTVWSGNSTVQNVTLTTKDNTIVQIDPFIENILDNPKPDVIFDNANSVNDTQSHDSITITKTDISYISSSVHSMNNTYSNANITTTNITISVSPNVASITSKNSTINTIAGKVNTKSINEISSATEPTANLGSDHIQIASRSDIVGDRKLDIDAVLGKDQFTDTNNTYSVSTDQPMDLNTFLRSLETGNLSNTAHDSNMVINAIPITDMNNPSNTETSFQMDSNTFPRADLIAETVFGTDMNNALNLNPSSVQSDKNIYTLPLVNQLDKAVNLDGSGVNKNNFIDTKETLNQEGLKSKSLPSEVNDVSQGTFTVSTGFTDSPLISTSAADSSYSVNTFGDKFIDQSMNNFFTEDSKTRRNTLFTGQSNNDVLATSSSALDWFSFLNMAPPPARNSDTRTSSEFIRNTVTEHDPTFGTSFRNNFFNSRPTTSEPEFQGKFQPCLMTKHTDPSKFYSSGIEMSCPPLLIWKQNKCYCDYPGPGDQTLTISTTDNTDTCDFLLKLDMENSYQNKYPQFKVDTRSQRRRITFENVKGSKGLAAHIIRSPLLVNAFQGNDLTATMHIKFKFRIASTRLNSRRLMILVSNGCGSSWSGPQPPSIALKFIPHNSTFKLVFRTDGKSVVEFLQPTVSPHDGWYHVALYLQDQWLTLEINKEKLYSSNGMKGSVIITPCPLKITGRTFEGYIDEFEVAKKCRYKSR